MPLRAIAIQASLVGLILLSGAPSALGRRGRGSIRGSPHDLTTGIAESGAGDDLCAFCHTPHTGGTAGPLWNVRGSVAAYRTYSSATMTSRAGQPDGASKLCLSCHDGQVTPELLRLPARMRSTAGGDASRARLPRPQKPLGANLSDDHPITIPYDARLGALRRDLRPPSTSTSGLGGTIREDLLDARGKVQCTSCHDAHNFDRPNFLVLPTEADTLCRACHAPPDYDLSAHAPAQARLLATGCATCHASHAAGSPAGLLKKPEPDLCTSCHRSRTGPGSGVSMSHGAAVRFGRSRSSGAVACSTCHEPHIIRPYLIYERAFLTDPDDEIRPPRLLTFTEVPYNGMIDPFRASTSPADFCLDCHDGSWPGAANIRNEIMDPRDRRTDFIAGNRNLHFVHVGGTSRSGAGCTYCHDVHGTTGTSGVRRNASLYPWLNVREFPYRGRRSCSSSDPASRCH